MRRVPRLKRPSGLTATTTGNGSRSTASNISHPQRSAHFSSSSSTTTHTLLPQRRPITRPLYSSGLSRFYSSDKKSESESESQLGKDTEKEKEKVIEIEAETETPASASNPTPVQESVQETTQQGENQQDQIQARREELEAETKAQPLPTDIDADKLAASEPEVPADQREFIEEDDVPVVAAPHGPYATPPPRAFAARESEVADPTYTPALTGAGLQTVGGLKSWWNKPENWDVSGDFVGFRPRQKVTEPALLEAAVRRAVIEAFALRKAGREDELVAVWPIGLHGGKAQSVLGTDIKRGEQGGALFARGDEEVQGIVEGLRWGDDVPVDESSGVGEAEKEKEKERELTAGEVAALSQNWDPSWKTIRLEDARIRFAITKRLFQLTGQRIHDHQFEDATTVQTLLHMIKKPLKPATVMEEIEKHHSALLDLPNVTMSGKRVTKGDKEKALGRYKVMQEEFKKRDLPGTGHGYAGTNKEIPRLLGRK